MAGTTSSSSTNFLENLPDELLDLVFGYIPHRGLPVRPISKRLLPFVQRALYRDIYLEEAPPLLALIRTANDGNRWLANIRYLALNPSMSSAAEFNLMDESDLFSLFTRLDGLKEFQAYGPKKIVRLLQSPAAMSSLFPALSSLLLQGHVTHTDAFHPAYLYFLPFYPNLTHLAYGVYITAQPYELKPLPAARADFPNITSLELFGKPSQSLVAPSLLPLFPNLVTLLLDDYAPAPNLNVLLKAVSAASSLRNLSISVMDKAHRHNLEQVLPLFSSLNSLSLGIGPSAAPSTFFQCLRDLPLSKLRLLEDARFSLNDMVDLFGKKTPHPTVRHLVLDSVDGRCGPSVIRCGGALVFHSTSDDDPCLHHGWVLPEWGTDPATRAAYTASDFRNLLASIDARVHVSGSALQALKVDERYAFEQRVLEAYKAALDEGRNPTRLEELEEFEGVEA
ncbi:hypothetical protein JCM10207_008475 [Rhodosporidiobolus poonsookiae]